MADPWLDGGERIKIQGLRQLVREIERINPEFGRQVRLINLGAAGDIADRARTLVPRRSGHLQESIRTAATTRGGQVLAGKASVPYAGPIHFGWLRRHIQPQPFLYDALDLRRDAVFDAYVRQVEQLVDAVMTLDALNR